ncbi:MAG TPA: sensor histidine kinase [Pseudolabrys sp.]|nr:sensor histidine kinase [Pseudolabrys sp.]
MDALNNVPSADTAGAAPAAQVSAHDILNALGEPTLLVTPSGLIEDANAAAKQRAGGALRGQNLCTLAGNDATGLSTYLTRCSGSGGALLGAVNLPDADGTRKYRCHGSRLAAGGRVLVLLRCLGLEEDRFSLLTHRIDQLNDEVRRHRRTEAVLAEALKERGLLVREIHHRVKNNVQILRGMLMASAHEAKHPESKASLEDAARRMAAMAAVQQALYSADQPTSHRADEFLAALIPTLRSTWPAAARIDYAADAINLPSDVTAPLALIINELATNALKYGTAQDTGTVCVRLAARDGEIELSVADNGPGFELGAITSRSSGLGLVRGLARQLGGRFTVTQDGGACCSVQFPVPAV